MTIESSWRAWPKTAEPDAALTENPQQTIVKRGDGITAREFVLVEPEDQLTRIVEKYDTYRNNFEISIADVERWARLVIKDMTEEDGTHPTAPIGDADTPENYAIRVLHNIGIVRALISEDNAVGAAAFAVELGAIITEARMKFKWERFALKGELLSNKARDEDRADFDVIVRDMKAQNPALTRDEVMRDSRVNAYAIKYPGKGTIPDWLNSHFPKRGRGRPRQPE